MTQLVKPRQSTRLFILFFSRFFLIFLEYTLFRFAFRLSQRLPFGPIRVKQGLHHEIKESRNTYGWQEYFYIFHV